jgi:quinoprotein glucose dehydrogenase
MFPPITRCFPVVFAVSAAFVAGGAAAAPAVKPPSPPKKVPSPEEVIKAAPVAAGLRMDVWAAEPMVSNPVAFTFDGKGRAWIAETQRRKSSLLDIRSFTNWKTQSLALKSVEEKVGLLKQILPEGGSSESRSLRDANGDGKIDWHDLEVESEVLRVVVDRDGDGKADEQRIIAQDFKSLKTGIAAGVATRGGEAFFVCEPDVWRVAEDGGKREIVQGLAVHLVYSGHDAHGAKFGPDGRLYFSVGDCSARVEAGGRVLAPPSSGAVFRCQPDGSGIELYAIGLRNPQSLAFNEVGDLFTGDNNADGGDKARWIHVVEGADYGWRLHYQFVSEPKLGNWNAEGIWKMESGREVPSVLPPVTHVGHGPAGVAYYPGTGLPAEYEGTFFMADFPGGVRAFKLEPKGASYAAQLSEKTLGDNSSDMEGKIAWKLNISDVAFGPGGGLYLLDCIDWIPDQNKFNKGRIFRVHSPEVDADPLVEQTRRLLAEGFAQRPVRELAGLLGHKDYRVRVEAQWALAERGRDALEVLAGAAREKGWERLHGVWGLGQVARTLPEALGELRKILLEISEAEVVAQTLKTLGENGSPADAQGIRKFLGHPEARVRFFAAQALRRVGSVADVEALLARVRAGDDADPYLRHSVVASLAVVAPPETLVALQKDAAEPVRMAAVLALRRKEHAGVASFLADAAPAVRLEAARAVYDQPVPAALEALADAPQRAGDPPGWSRRVLAARHRLGGRGNAERLVGLGADSDAAKESRVQALGLLKQWEPEDGRDVFLGRWWPLEGAREIDSWKPALEKASATLFSDPDPAVRVAAVEAAVKLGLKSTAEAMALVLTSPGSPTAARVAALGALSKWKAEGFAKILSQVLVDKDKALADEAAKLIGKLPAEEAAKLALRLVEEGSVPQRQGALATLGQTKHPIAEKGLERLMDDLLAGKTPAGLVLDVLEAAAKRGTPALRTRLKAYENSRPSTDPLAQWRECLEGGDPKAGLKVFREKDEVGCFRCHKAAGSGGDVGPAMDRIGTQRDREYLLRSIVLPNADYAQGFETFLFTLKDGGVAAGMLTREDAKTLQVVLPGGTGKQVLEKEQIVKRDRLPSPMPEGLGKLLSKRELRDIVAFLESQK